MKKEGRKEGVLHPRVNIRGAGKSAEDSFSAKKHVVREGGVEPPPHFWDTDLNRARLPIRMVGVEPTRLLGTRP